MGMMSPAIERASAPTSAVSMQSSVRSFTGMDRQSSHSSESIVKNPCTYSHAVFTAAGTIFDALKHKLQKESESDLGLQTQNNRFMRPTQVVQSKSDTDSSQSEKKVMYIPNIDFKSDTDKRDTFDLAFNTLKYQKLLHEILEDVAFFSQFPEFIDDSGIVMVMLYDYQTRKFHRWTPVENEEQSDLLLEMEEALSSCRTKLNAALARLRIKAQAQSVENLLPELIRMKEKVSSSMLIHAWVNQIKTSISAVIEQLKEDGLHLSGCSDALEGSNFCQDVNCPDVLTFPPNLKEFLTSHIMVKEGNLVIQDKSSCIGAHSVKALLNDGDDIVMVNVGSGLTAAHICSLSHPSQTQIYACGVKSGLHMDKIKEKLDLIGAKKVQLIMEEFTNIEHDDSRFKQIKTFFAVVNCTRSGVTNPVDFVVNEGEDVSILKDLSVCGQDDNRLGERISEHTAMLRHALRFPKAQAVVYFTRSVHEAENENVVSKSMEFVNMLQQRKSPYKASPPTLPLTDYDIESSGNLTNNGKYLRFPPSSKMSGCFIAVITREAEDPKEAAKDILARAAAKGLLGVPKTDAPTKKEKKEKAKSSQSHSEKLSVKSSHSKHSALRRVYSSPHKHKHKGLAHGGTEGVSGTVSDGAVLQPAGSHSHEIPITSNRNDQPSCNSIYHGYSNGFSSSSLLSSYYNDIDRESHRNMSNTQPSAAGSLRGLSQEVTGGSSLVSRYYHDTKTNNGSILIPRHRNTVENYMSDSRSHSSTTNNPSRNQSHVHFAPKMRVSERLYPPPKPGSIKKTLDKKKSETTRVLQSPSTVTPQLRLIHCNRVKHPSAFR